jgi:hypothetical protein
MFQKARQAEQKIERRRERQREKFGLGEYLNE